MTCYRYMCRACLREFSDWPQLQSHHDAEHPTIERGFTIIDPHIKQVWTGASDPVGLLNVCSTRINAFGTSHGWSMNALHAYVLSSYFLLCLLDVSVNFRVVLVHW